jgi:hypothetical protein
MTLARQRAGLRVLCSERGTSEQSYERADIAGALLSCSGHVLGLRVIGERRTPRAALMDRSQEQDATGCASLAPQLRASATTGAMDVVPEAPTSITSNGARVGALTVDGNGDDGSAPAATDTRQVTAADSAAGDGEGTGEDAAGDAAEPADEEDGYTKMRVAVLFGYLGSRFQGLQR